MSAAQPRNANIANGDHDQVDHWEVFWCLDGWHLLRDKVVAKLPQWATLRTADPSRPLAEQVGNAAVLVPTTAVVDATVIRAAKRCRLITQPAAGYNNIAIEAAAACGIPVTTGPGVNAASVAEGALMSMLMIARRVGEQQETFRQRGIGFPMGTQLAGKTLGIIGMGNIGRRLARAAEALDMTVVGTSSRSSREELEALLSAADIISVHCPLTPATQDLIGYKELALCKSGVLLVNYARGECLQKQALLDGLESGRIAGLCMDVHWVEPADPNEQLYKHPNVVALPHTGTSTHEVFEKWASLLTDNIRHAHAGRMNELWQRVV